MNQPHNTEMSNAENQPEEIWEYDVIVGEGEPVAHDSLPSLIETLRELVQCDVKERVLIRTMKTTRQAFEALPETEAVRSQD